MGHSKGMQQEKKKLHFLTLQSVVDEGTLTLVWTTGDMLKILRQTPLIVPHVILSGVQMSSALIVQHYAHNIV